MKGGRRVIVVKKEELLSLGYYFCLWIINLFINIALLFVLLFFIFIVLSFQSLITRCFSFYLSNLNYRVAIYLFFIKG